MAPALEEESRLAGPLDRRAVVISLVATAVAIVATVTARVLVSLISLVTNIAYYGRLSFQAAEPAGHARALWSIFVPVVGGLIVGAMARYGSRAIRGHGIPEAMEQVLTNGSKIPPRITFLKPVSSAIVIGTGGPFGAEGPIIATGGALGSLVGQLLKTTAVERKTLLAAGAAAGMTAIFGSPLAAVVLAIELLLFELRPRTLIPVAIACAAAASVRTLFFPGGAVFGMSGIASPPLSALFVYALLGFLIGIIATAITKLVYAVEDGFEHLPVHWMWWPAIGGLVVGIVGYIAPRTLGVGYVNIDDMLNGRILGTAILTLCVWKLVSWSIALGSGTSGGTLAPLLTIGGALGAAIGGGIASVAPGLGVDPRVAALVSMAALFAGASRAFLTSVVFALETTQQSSCLLPLLAACASAYLVSCLFMENTIMTEKIVRRGIRVPTEYVADYLDHVHVGAVAIKPVVTLSTLQGLREIRDWLRTHRPETEHQGYPVLDADGQLAGIVTRRNLLDPAIADDHSLADLVGRPPVVIEPSATLREAADEMVRHSIGRLPVVDETGAIVGIVTRSDLLAAHRPRIQAHEHVERSIQLRRVWKKRPIG